jgi:hypothetical protein
VMKLEVVELVYQLGLTICRHLRINIVFLFHDLVHEKF